MIAKYNKLCKHFRYMRTNKMMNNFKSQKIFKVQKKK